jgi:hypothetical protein
MLPIPSASPFAARRTRERPCIRDAADHSSINDAINMVASATDHWTLFVECFGSALGEEAMLMDELPGYREYGAGCAIGCCLACGDEMRRRRQSTCWPDMLKQRGRHVWRADQLPTQGPMYRSRNVLRRPLSRDISGNSRFCAGDHFVVDL